MLGNAENGVEKCCDAHDTLQYFPAACYTVDSLDTSDFPAAPKGNPSRTEHSWRVMVMPYMEDTALATSKTLLVVESAGRPTMYRGKAKLATGEVNQCLGWADSLGPFKLHRIGPDGMKNSVPKNQGLPFNATNDGEALSFHPAGMNVVFCDGSTRHLNDDIDLAVFAGIVTRAGGLEPRMAD